MSEEFDDLHPAVRALKSVCRCNNVKYKTIEKAIRAGATTIREIAIRTTATTGYCGGTCTPEVQEMIDSLRPPPQKAAAVKDGDADEWWVRKK